MIAALALAGAALIEPGAAPPPVVVAAGATAAEREAALQLARYLGRATGSTWRVVEEGPAVGDAPALFVGPSAEAAAAGIDAADLGPDDWRLRRTGRGLVLAGGRPRGTLYAVFHFLERQVGVRWWTPFDDFVPAIERLPWPATDESGRPAFAYRDVHGVDGPREFLARARINGHYSFLPARLGGREAYGPPFHVHDFFMYVPPETYFDAHPEFYSELGGRRRGERSQLCLTNAALEPLVAGRLRSYVAQARREAAAAGEAPPRLFGFSQNDWRGHCRCAACRAVRDREGSDAGALIEFLGRLAARVAPEFPDLLLDTLAYQDTLRPPRHARAPDNVVVRVSGLWQRDFMRPVTDPANREYREALAGWREKAAHLWVWDYSVTFGRSPNNFPLPNLRVLAADLRHYAALGVEGLFVQHDHPVMADLRDLKLWVLLKLIEDPSRDLDRLVAEFAAGYYGPAATPILAHLAALERVARASGASIRHPTDAGQFVWLDAPFLLAAHARFDAAERAVAADPVLVARVRHARLSLDRATLWRFDPRLGPALVPREIAARLLATVEAEATRRLPAARAAEELARVRAEVEEALARLERKS